MSPSRRQQLDQEGFVVLPDVMPEALLHRVRQRVERLFRTEGDQAGSEFSQEPGCRRLANLVNKGDVFREVLQCKEVLGCVSEVLSQFKLSSLNVRRVEARSSRRQPLHADMGALPDEQGPWVCNTLWMLDDFCIDNGPLRVVPGSHQFRRLPEADLPDPTAPHPDEVLVTGRAGTVVVMNAHLWHGGTENRTDATRTAMHGFFCRRDKPQQQYQKRWLDASVQASLPDDLRMLLALDDPLNDQLSADVAVRSGFMKEDRHAD